MNSHHACPAVSTGALGRFINDYQYWLAVPLILLGGYLFAVGGKFPNATLALFSTLSAAFTLLFVLYVMVLPNMTPSWSVWIVGFVCIGLGSGLGFASGRWPDVGIVIMGLTLGVLIGYWVQYIVLKSSDNLGPDSSSTKFGLVLSVALFTAALCYWMFDYAVITTSGIIGAYIFVRVSHQLFRIFVINCID